jgi:hypothetical protein
MHEQMEAIVEHCVEPDVHQATVLACRDAGPTGVKPTRQILRHDTQVRLSIQIPGVNRIIAAPIIAETYHMLATGTGYKNRGASYLDRFSAHRTTDNLVRWLRHIGYNVRISSFAV